MEIVQRNPSVINGTWKHAWCLCSRDTMFFRKVQWLVIMFLILTKSLAVPQWTVLDSSSAPVWENTHPTLSLPRHWCSVWKIKTVAHSALSPPSLNSNINMYDRVWWGREELGEIGKAMTERKGKLPLTGTKIIRLNYFCSSFKPYRTTTFYMPSDTRRFRGEKKKWNTS